MSDEPTETITIEVTEQQFNDALRAINSREVELQEKEHSDQERINALSNVWAQLYRGGRDAFRDLDTEADEEVSADV